ncbi:MAG: arginyl-tRNA synthetase [Chthoniobacter sp.]|nr:arginyl-tRNA synthetase [Chthoniobacter sp.]
MQTLISLLEERLRTAVSYAGEIEPRVTGTADPRFGDYQTNVAMLLAKQQRANPRQIATQIIERLDVSGICETPEIAGAGFINFRINTAFLNRRFNELCHDEMLGVSRAKPKKIVLDFSGPNIAKPMHVGHIRSTIIGDTLARVARFLGHEVIADNHLGDWGTQFGKVIYGWKNWRDEAALAARPVEELVRLYKKANALSEQDETVLRACRDELVKLQGGDAENIAIWRQCVELSWHEFEQMYALLDVHFDKHLGESSYNDRLAPLVAKLESTGIAEQSEGATCVFFRDDSALADKPCLIRKTDGGFLYATTDLATIEYRIERWNPDEIWYVVGAPQALHFEQVFGVARKMGVTAQLRFIPFGSILGEDRKLMKTRSGDNVQLRELLEEAQQRARAVVEQKNAALSDEEKNEIATVIGIGAVKYADLSQARMTDYVFSWDKMLSLQGNTAPYLQNAFVRIRSIFRKIETGSWEAGKEDGALAEPSEISLAKKLMQFGETVPLVLDDFRPNILANYLYELANTFHGFYEACPVLKADEPMRSTRLALCDLTARVLERGLSLLGIRAPEKM